MQRIPYLFLVALIILPLAIFGCKSKVDRADQEEKAESLETMPQSDAPLEINASREPSQSVASETIPPTAAAQTQEAVSTATQELMGRARDIQAALKKAGFYAGAIDGKIGPRTKQAILDFQKSKGLKADGKVGPKTWAELEKYLVRQ